jgi:transformation/transcription domain-associated protein
MTRALEGAFDCMYMSELQADAEALIKQITSHVFFTDARRGSTAAGGQLRRWPSPHLTTLIDTLPNALVRSRPEERDPAQAFIARVITDLVDASNDTPEEITSFLLNIATRFTSMCLGDTWSRRTGGCRGVRIMLELPMLGIDWVRDREVELIRTLLHVLKHVPSDLLDDVKHVTELLVRVLTASHAGPPADPAPPKLTHIMGVLFTELPSQSSVVRETVHKCIDVVADLVGRSPYELLLPHRERALASLYTKPLRALQYSTQIGVIEAFRYCLRTSPPLPEVNEELLRLLQETIAYATADEATLIGRVNQRQGTIDVIKLKVVCLLLLTAAIPVADYFVTRPAYQER